MVIAMTRRCQISPRPVRLRSRRGADGPLGFLVALPAWWATMGDVGGRHLGALFGVCNMIGLAGGAVSQIFLGAFADHMKDLGYEGRAQWDPAFSIYGAVLMAGGLLWLFMNPRRTVVPEDARLT